MDNTPSEDFSGKEKMAAWVVGLIGLLIVVALVGLVTSIRTVGTGKVGVVTRFGQVTGRELNEGLHLVSPFWTETVKRYDVRVLKEETDVQAASEDLQDITAKLAVNYQPMRGNVIDIHRNIGPKYKEAVLIPAINEVFKAASAKYTATEVITNRNAVKGEAFKALKERMIKYNIEVIDLSIVNFSFSPEFSKAIEEKQVAQQNAEKARQDLERIKVEAEQNITRATGEAEAQRLQQQTLTAEILQKQALEKWNGVLPTTNAGGNPFSILLQR